MISISNLLHAGHRFNQVVSALLVIVIGLISSLDSPEGYEQALENRIVSDVSLVRFDSHSAALEEVTEKRAFKSARERKTKYFDEDYILTWLSSVNVWPSQTGINIDPSNAKYKAYYSRGNLTSRYLLVAKYRDYVDLNNQQYGRSIH